MNKFKDKSFFEIYAHEYDALTDVKNRISPHEKEVKSIIDKFHPSNVLDAGCATGLTSYLFSKYNISTVGIDCSKAMIKIAKEKYIKNDLSFCHAWFEKLPKNFNNKFDLIVCLANAISGVGSEKNLRDSLSGFKRSLQPKGTLILQMLNFKNINEGEIIPIKITRKSNIIYQRFMIKKSNKIFIYINRIDLNLKPIKQEIFSHEFNNLRLNELIRLLKNIGYKKITKHSNLFFDSKFNDSSKDLVITATK